MMKIKVKMRCQFSSTQEVKFSTPSGHHLQAGEVGRRIRKAMRPDTAVPPFLGLLRSLWAEFWFHL